MEEENKNRRRFLKTGAVMAAGATVALVAGCSSDKEEKKAEAATATPASTTDAKAPVKKA